MASDGLILKMYVLCKDLLMSPKYINIVFILLLALECCFLPLIIWKVSYTEIDWTAYMQEVEGFLNGTTDYHQLKGDTGPLV
jgi:alpha-1,3-mannosyltransferase